MNRIGVFDSGLGGLTVLNEICKYNQGLDIIYFGDTARVPYGSRTVDTIARYAEQDVRFLLAQGVEGIVIACGTVSAIGLDSLRQRFGVPIFGVIEAASAEALRRTTTDHITVLGTKATVQSGAYSAEIHKKNNGCKVTQIACPLLVPLIENGFAAEDPITMLTLQRYLQPIMDGDSDTLILGCTHYPYLDRSIRSLLPKVQTINIGTALAKALPSLMALDPSDSACRVTYYVSDPDTDFQAIANANLDSIRADSVHSVNIELF